MKHWRWMVAGAALAAAPQAVSAQDAGTREVEVVVDQGYEPSRVEATAGERLRVRFLRRSDGGCTREVVFPTLNLRRELPTGQPVVVDLPPLPAGETPFHCGMNMVRGVIVARVAAPPPPPPPPARRVRGRR
jgi:plastocyanin domain-containing protein